MVRISSVGNAIKMAILLQSRGKMKIVDLSRELEVSERQIRKYRSHLEQAGIFIDAKTGSYGGYTLMSNGNLLGLNISDNDINILDMINEQLQYSNDIYKNDFNIIKDKLRALVNMKTDTKGSMSYFAVQPKVNMDAEFEKQKCDEIIYACITNKKVRINYNTLASGLTDRVVHPYAIYTYKSDRYIAAYCENRNEIRDFKICRIQEYKILEEKFKKSHKFSWYEYSKNCIGIYKDKEIAVKLKIKYPFSVIIKEKEWVDNQEIIDNEDKSILFIARMKGYTEVKSWILSMGSNVEVLEPKKLKEDIITEIEKIKNLY